MLTGNNQGTFYKKNNRIHGFAAIVQSVPKPFFWMAPEFARELGLSKNWPWTHGEHAQVRFPVRPCIPSLPQRRNNPVLHCTTPRTVQPRALYDPLHCVAPPPQKPEFRSHFSAQNFCSINPCRDAVCCIGVAGSTDECV